MPPDAARSTDSNWRAWPKVNSRNSVPTVEGAYTPSNSVFIPPLRSTSTSSMLSAPAHMPAISVASFGAGLAEPGLDPRRCDLDLVGQQSEQPGLLGQRHHRHQPGTRHEIVLVEHRGLRGEPVRNLHRKCLSELDRLLRENTNHPSSEGTFFIPTPRRATIRQWIEAKRVLESSFFRDFRPEYRKRFRTTTR